MGRSEFVLFLFTGFPFRKNRVPQQPPEQYSISWAQKDTEPRAASQAPPLACISRAGVGGIERRSLHGEPSSQRQYLPSPSFPAPALRSVLEHKVLCCANTRG